MRYGWLIVFGWWFSAVCGLASLPLPEWTKEEREQLEKGQLIPGASLLVEIEETPAAVVPKKEVEEERKSIPKIPEPEIKYNEQTVPPESLPVYFNKDPRGYLIDPQRLLTMQETADRKGFLNYHAEDADIDIRMYLFDGKQQIPEPYSLRSLVDQRYADDPLTLVVFYFLGEPSRTTLAFGGRGAEQVSKREQLRILDSARIRSLEVSDGLAQMEALIVQLSISLYWLEKSFKEREAIAIVPTKLGVDEKETQLETGDRLPLIGFLSDDEFYWLFVIGSVLLISVSFLAVWIIWQRSRRYHFPGVDLPKRLGADYGAGVGAVIGFRDSFGSPVDQRERMSKTGGDFL